MRKVIFGLALVLAACGGGGKDRPSTGGGISYKFKVTCEGQTVPIGTVGYVYSSSPDGRANLRTSAGEFLVPRSCLTPA